MIEYYAIETVSNAYSRNVPQFTPALTVRGLPFVVSIVKPDDFSPNAYQKISIIYDDHFLPVPSTPGFFVHRDQKYGVVRRDNGQILLGVDLDFIS